MMMNRNAVGLSGLLLASLFATAGCGNDNNNNNNGNNNEPICTANTKTCLDDHHARICSKEGAEWYTITCDANETCNAGDCVADEVEPPDLIVCFPGDGKCMPGTPDKSLSCRSDGTGFTATDCPTGTACVGAGVCVGVCAVGSSICLDGKTLATCTNGTGYTTTTCGATEACVTTGDTPVDTAACKASECQPSTDGCDFVCGNRTDPSADQTRFLSLCVETPNGYKWTALGCSTGQICDAQGGAQCGAGGAKREAACAGACTDGDSMCDEAGNIVFCVGSQWSVPMPCANPKSCFADPLHPTHALCGDFICTATEGECTDNGQIKRCDATGNVVATATDCASGSCLFIGTANGLTGGVCAATCKDGESECVGEPGLSITVRSCEGGKWTKLQNCETGFCFASGRNTALCGVCAPGTAKCDEPADGARAKIAVCDASGQWAAFADCTLGQCVGDDGAASCVAQCIPGNIVCTGETLETDESAGPNYGGYVATGSQSTCDANGLLPETGTECDEGKACRYNVSGKVLGCVECVYDNEYGQIDSRCTGEDSNSLQFCTAANTWGTAAACGTDQFCDTPYTPFFIDEATVYAIPAPADREYCHACKIDVGGGTVVLGQCTASALAAYGFACGDIYDDPSSTSCDSRFSATTTVSDCCYYACDYDDNILFLPPIPASCVAND